MRLLADENVPRAAVDALRHGGHDVKWVRTDAPGISDTQVLSQAVEEHRLVLTLDKDFGELAFSRRLPASCGVILVRVSSTSPSDLASAITIGLASHSDWAGHFAVIERGRVRMTELPEQPA